MSALIAKLVREPALLIGVLAGIFGVLVAFDVPLTEKQTGAIIIALGAVMALVRYLTTPSAEVAVQVVKGEVLAGPAAIETTGVPTSLEHDEGLDETVASVSIKPELLT